MMPRLRALSDVLSGFLHLREFGVQVGLRLVAIRIGELERRSGQRAKRTEGLRAVAEFKVKKGALAKLRKIAPRGDPAVEELQQTLFDFAEFAERARKQQQTTLEVPPRRGFLYDRNLHELAMTVQVDSIFAVPSEIDPAQTSSLSLVSKPSLVCAPVARPSDRLAV